jgi:hypothetical protein
MQQWEKWWAGQVPGWMQREFDRCLALVFGACVCGVRCDIVVVDSIIVGIYDRYVAYRQCRQKKTGCRFLLATYSYSYRAAYIQSTNNQSK